MAKLRNIIEDIADDFLKNALSVRFDICTCEQCKNDMLAYILSRIPAKYVTTEEQALQVIIEQTKLEHQAEFARAVLEAIHAVGEKPRHEIQEDKNENFNLLLNKIFEDRGIDFRHYHRELLKRRVAIRIRANHTASYSDYLRVLINKPEEYDRLLEVLCINVSEFFRDSAVWDALRAVLEREIHSRLEANNNFFRIWSAGCANGEEPFSLAVLMKEISAFENRPLTIDINATDIDKKVLDFVRNPEYTRESLKNAGTYLLTKYFDAHGGNYRPKEELKKMVNFKPLDLTSDALIRNVDLIVCRNVFIYYDRNLQEQILMKFYKALRPGGFLMMGKVESLILEAREIFQEIDIDARIYKKKI
ncbi:MAG: CheR family methyltransferase [Candidatus Omnitrophota bacterium]|jgi:chemotaxis methyl-accepting protein methylase